MAKAPVSVIIAVRDGAKFISEALQSVYEQTWPPEDVIVIDDGSIDETSARVRRFSEARYVRQPPLGFAHAKNHGVRLASQPYLAFLDADDLWPPTKTEIQLNVLANDLNLDFVYGLVVQFVGSPTQAMSQSAFAPAARVLGSVTIKRDSLRKVGLFATDWIVGSAIEWWTRAGDLGLQGKCVPQLALLRRIHETNLGRITHEPMRDYLSILHSVVNRRREGQ
jgi:glycosyltransferase involved in cell wall biosynthesis